MTARRVAFVIPGELESATGGYIYDRRLIAELRRLGRDVTHVRLGDGFPEPTASDARHAAEALAAIPAECPAMIDGLALGALDKDLLAELKSPLVALVHHPLALETGLPPERRAHLQTRERNNLRLAEEVIATSPHTAALLRADYGVPAERVTVARPGVDAIARTATGRPPRDPPLILSVGLQVPRKGHDVLLRALALVADRPWQAVIVGTAQDADCAADLARLRQKLHLGTRVRFAGRVPEETLARLYADASIFALATRYEGHGLVFDEAMQYGLPIVTCRTGAVPDTVAEGAALLVPPDDPAAFAQALARVLDAPEFAAAMAQASEEAGQRLPAWTQTGRVVEAVLARVDGASAMRHHE